MTAFHRLGRVHPHPRDLRVRENHPGHFFGGKRAAIPPKHVGNRLFRLMGGGVNQQVTSQHIPGRVHARNGGLVVFIHLHKPVAVCFHPRGIQSQRLSVARAAQCREQRFRTDLLQVTVVRV